MKKIKNAQTVQCQLDKITKNLLFYKLLKVKIIRKWMNKKNLV